VTQGLLVQIQQSIIAINMHIDDGTGICSSKEEELELKAGIQKFYKIKEKNPPSHSKCLEYWSQETLTMAPSSYPTRVHRLNAQKI